MRLAALALCALVACGDPRPPGVVLWHSYTGQERAALEATAATWNAEHPDTPLTLVAVPHDAFADKISSAIPRGNGPDLFIFAQDRIGDWADAGVIEPIEFWVDDARADRFSDLSLGAMTYKGSLWGLPLATKSLVLFYRTDMIATPPTTTDQLFALEPQLHARGASVLAYANFDLYGHAPWLHGFGGRVLDEHGTLAIATPEAARAIAFARELIVRDVTPSETTGPLVASLFNDGKAAMAMSGPWFIADIDRAVPWKVAPLPIVSETGKPAAPFLGVEGILMSAKARDKDAAFAVMNALTGDRAAIVRARQAQQVVANVHAWDQPDLAGDPVLRVFRAQLAHVVAMPTDPVMRMVWTPYRTALDKVLHGNGDAGAELRRVEREVQGNR
ncbi:MAG TPA: extracellular solute-binding protein [Kofleriaceae bacterium]|nr:extracellular solute-binding protein [Kofleriaceae bacterium]